MLKTVHLHGRLKKEFGATHRFDVRTAAEALRALNCAFPTKFVAALEQGSYKIIRGSKTTGMALDLDLVCSFNLGLADLHIIPVATGSKNNTKGIAKTIIGVALIGGAIFMSGGTLAAPLGGIGSTAFSIGGMSISYGSIALVGLGLALSGVSSLIAGTQKTEEKPSDESYTINGPSNGARNGQAIPLIYGECIVGSVTVSFDADIEDIGAYQGVTGSMGSSVQAVKDRAGAITYYGGS